LGHTLFFIGTIAAIIIGIILYGKKNPKDRRNGKYILITAIIVALIMFIIISFTIPALIIYNSYFGSQSFNTQEDIVTTRNISRSAANHLLNRYL